MRAFSGPVSPVYQNKDGRNETVRLGSSLLNLSVGFIYVSCLLV